MLYLALPELREPLLLLHHAVTAVLAYLAIYPVAYCHYYILFFAGVAEASNVPLALVELCKLLPGLRAALPTTELLARASFFASFVVLRLLCWPLVALLFWRDSLRVLVDGPVHSHFAVLFYLAANALLTAMQLGWGFKLVRKLPTGVIALRQALSSSTRKQAVE